MPSNSFDFFPKQFEMIFIFMHNQRGKLVKKRGKIQWLSVKHVEECIKINLITIIYYS